MPPNGHLLLGQTADPEIDVVQAAESLPPAIRAGRVEEVETVAGRAAAAEHDARSPRRALPSSVVAAVIDVVRAVGRDEVDERLRVLQVQREVGPARVGLQLGVAGAGEELGAGLVQRRNAGVAAAGDVERGKVERQAEQIVAQGLGDELVDLVAAPGGSCRG